MFLRIFSGVAVFVLFIVTLSDFTKLCDGSTTTYIEPIKCEQYEDKLCQDEKKCEPEEIECEPSDKPNHCFVVWRTNNVTGNITIQMKGCFTQNEVCNQTKCIDNSPSKKNGEINFCCCGDNLCNKEHIWIPTTSMPTKTEEQPTDDSQLYVIYVIISVTIVFAMITSAVLFYILRQRTHAMMPLPTSEPELSGSTGCLTLRPIQLLEMKARGRFGTVWRAQMKPDEVAVKIFPMQEKESWITEHDIYKLPRMKHSNILEFIAAEKHTDSLVNEFWLITAYHNNGSLCDYLKAYTVTWTELCLIAESMARGLMHLHEEIQGNKADGLKPAIAHRDFKSKNVLLKNDLTACIADFGLALVFSPNKPCGDTHGQVGTRRYMAPEVLEGAINFTRDAFLRIDVYACGLVLWELASRCIAHNGIVPSYALPFESELGLHPSLEEMQENVVIKKLRPKIEDVWRTHPGLNAICDTMEECWDHDAEARLSSSCVMERVAQHRRYPTTHLLIETNTEHNLCGNIS